MRSSTALPSFSDAAVGRGRSARRCNASASAQQFMCFFRQGQPWVAKNSCSQGHSASDSWAWNTAAMHSPDPVAAKIGRRIRVFREELGLTREKLAYEGGLSSKGHLSGNEGGPRSTNHAHPRAAGGAASGRFSDEEIKHQELSPRRERRRRTQAPARPRSASAESAGARRTGSAHAHPPPSSTPVASAAFG
jgi:hypothetical protein